MNPFISGNEGANDDGVVRDDRVHDTVPENGRRAMWEVNYSAVGVRTFCNSWKRDHCNFGAMPE